ncbi:MAG: hypothetical protein AAGK32_11020, partial [Actinomycetota bacterium]
MQGRLTGGELWTLFGFGMMFIHPVSRNWLIFPIYIISAAVGLFRFVRRREWSWAPLALAFVVFTGGVLTLLGILRGTPGGLRVALPIIFGPCVYYAIALGLDRQTTRYLPRLIAFSTGLVGVSMLIVAFAEAFPWRRRSVGAGSGSSGDRGPGRWRST